ncbi:hypothetical protein HK097_003502 [Rhizophlyctis rosea]|uniref:SH3 domain-containing protein n=1 Tax=Rhizophlyctis rosea TaxID=64517 RepID=A0AAD5S4T1_9FUNG|nr:hypothetical protein HK097_003502 [Rhizophlyctis rosea]
MISYHIGSYYSKRGSAVYTPQSTLCDGTFGTCPTLDDSTATLSQSSSAAASPVVGLGGVFLAMVAVGALFGRKRAKSELKITPTNGKPSNGKSMEEARDPSTTPPPESRHRSQTMSSSWKSNFSFSKVMRGRKDSIIEEKADDDTSSDSSANASTKSVKTTDTKRSSSTKRSRSLSVSAPSSPIPFKTDEAPPLPTEPSSMTIRNLFVDKEKERQKERERKGKARSTSPIRPPLTSNASSSTIKTLNSPTATSPTTGQPFFPSPGMIPIVIPAGAPNPLDPQNTSSATTGSDLSDSDSTEETQIRIKLIYGPPPRNTGGSSTWLPPCEVGTLCRAVISHSPEEIDEMMLRRGELVRVEAFYEDGWVRVKLDDPLFGGGKGGLSGNWGVVEKEPKDSEKEEKESKPSRWAIVSKKTKKPKPTDSGVSSLNSSPSTSPKLSKSKSKKEAKIKAKPPGTLNLDRIMNGMVPWHCLQVATEEDLLERQRQFVALASAQSGVGSRSPLQESMKAGVFAAKMMA